MKNSQLDWTIVRPGNFVRGTHTRQYQAGFTTPDRSVKFKISQPDVADFMLKQLTDTRYLHKTPSLSY